MSLANLTLAQLKAVTNLIERKHALLGAVASIDKEISSIEAGGEITSPAAGAKRGRKMKAAKSVGGPRGRKPAPVKERIIGVLKAAGKSGIRPKDIAAQLGKSVGGVGVWLYTTGKKIKEIKKIGPGLYRWEQ